MKLLREDEVPPRRYGETLFREARARRLVTSLVFLTLSVAGFAIAINPGLLPEFPRVMAWAGGPFMALFAAVFFYSSRATLRRSNWILRYDGRGLYIKFRSYLNHHLPSEDRVVAHVPGGEIAWIRKASERLKTRAGRETRYEWITYIDVRLDHTDTDELASRLAEERQKGGRGRAKWHHFAVRLVEPDLLRIEWKSGRSVVRPGVEEALRILGGSVPVREPLELERPAMEELDPAGREARIRSLAEMGRDMAAIRLAQEHLGLDGPGEARRYVDRLLHG